MNRFAAFVFTSLPLIASCAGSPPPVVPAPDLDRPRAELIRELDRMIQSRLSTITAEDLSRKAFGPNRLVAWNEKPGHPRVFAGRFPDPSWQAAVYVVRDRGEDGSAGRVSGPILEEGSSWAPAAGRREIEELAHRAMSMNTPFSGASHGIPLEARVVVASAPLCLKCHADKKVGDPVGAVVYAFRRQRPPVATPGHESGK